MTRDRAWAWAGALAVALAPAALSAQDIADIDYENLSFRGFGLDWGYMYPDQVEPTATYGLRLDLGYAGPGLRIVPSVSYWKSPFEPSEITEFESRIEELVFEQTGEVTTVELGAIEYSDISVAIDGHVVWEVPFDLLTFGGLGVAAHILNGDGAAINGTFVEDLLDTVTAGFNLHLGAEYPVTERMRIYGVTRYEVMPDLRHFRLQVGWQFMTGPNAPGEGRGG
jgi:hypothetical protein